MVDRLTAKEVLTEGAARRTVIRVHGAAEDVAGAAAVEGRLNLVVSLERGAREEHTRVQ